jgi:hypothetical protein
MNILTVVRCGSSICCIFNELRCVVYIQAQPWRVALMSTYERVSLVISVIQMACAIAALILAILIFHRGY